MKVLVRRITFDADCLQIQDNQVRDQRRLPVGMEYSLVLLSAFVAMVVRKGPQKRGVSLEIERPFLICLSLPSQTLFRRSNHRHLAIHNSRLNKRKASPVVSTWSNLQEEVLSIAYATASSSLNRKSVTQIMFESIYVECYDIPLTESSMVYQSNDYRVPHKNLNSGFTIQPANAHKKFSYL